MAIQTIKKEKAHKKTQKIIIIFAVVMYIYTVFTILHYSAILRLNPRLSMDEIINKAMMNVFLAPMEIFPVSSSTLLMVVLISVIIGVFAFINIMDRDLRKHDNPNVVGNAHFMTAEELETHNLKRVDPIGKKEIDPYSNVLITEDLYISLDGFKSKRNCNMLVIGGSGTGKTRYVVAPNILQMNSNYVISDPSGELLNSYGKFLEANGYKVKVFNLVDLYKSSRYNPLHYIKTEDDVFVIVDSLIKNTTPPKEHSGDPFWEKCERMLLSALILYLWHVYPEEVHTFSTITKLVNMSKIDENDTTSQSKLDLLMEDLRKEDPENLALQEYDTFRNAAGNTMKSILISLGSRLDPFKLSNIQYLTSKDEMEFETFADTRQALFVIMPTVNGAYNFLAALLYTQMFTSFYNYVETRVTLGSMAKVDNIILKVEQAKNEKESAEAKKKIETYISDIHAGTKIVKNDASDLYEIRTNNTDELIGWRGKEEDAKKFQASLKNIKIETPRRTLPNHIQFILDEFANIGQIPDFQDKLSTVRKYSISCVIILQSKGQFKKNYKDDEDALIGNCDILLYLGGNDTQSQKWIIEKLGKRETTIENTSYNSNNGGSISYNHNSAELITIDRLASMDENDCLAHIRGEAPFFGKKYDLLNHPRFKASTEYEGKFEIKIPERVQKRIEATSGPLRTRRKLDAEIPDEFFVETVIEKKVAKSDNDSNADETALFTKPGTSPASKGESTAKTKSAKPRNPEVPEETPFLVTTEKVKNKARKDAAKENAAQKEIGEEVSLDDMFNEFMSGISSSPLPTAAKPEITEEMIQETIETIIDLNFATTTPTFESD